MKSALNQTCALNRMLTEYKEELCKTRLGLDDSQILCLHGFYFVHQFLRNNKTFRFKGPTDPK